MYLEFDEKLLKVKVMCNVEFEAASKKSCLLQKSKGFTKSILPR